MTTHGHFVLAIITTAILLTGEIAQGETLTRDRCIDHRNECHVPDMVRLNPGTFQMGTNLHPVDNAFDASRPVHGVSIKYKFWISKYNITIGQYKAFVAESKRPAVPCSYNTPDNYKVGQTSIPGSSFEKPSDSFPYKPDTPYRSDNDPVTCVSWDDAQAYVKWLSRITGKRYRLLSESEWELAASDGKDREYWWSDNPGVNPVSTFPGRGKCIPDTGVCDIVGVVWTWLEDCYHSTYGVDREAPADGAAWTWESATGPNFYFNYLNIPVSTCMMREVRGGSWSLLKFPSTFSSFRRHPGTINNRDYDDGFRVARDD